MTIDREFESQLSEFRNDHDLDAGNAFVAWFVCAFILDSAGEAVRSLVGGANDNNVDSVVVSSSEKKVFVVQGKYHRGLGSKAIVRDAVETFASRAAWFSASTAEFKQLAKGLAPAVRQRIEEARSHVREHGYVLSFLFVTTGTVSSRICDKGKQIFRSFGDLPKGSTFDTFQWRDLTILAADYRDGVSPAVPELEISICDNEVIERYQPSRRIKTLIFFAPAADIGRLFEKARHRLFARNVRGFLGGNKRVNKAIAESLTSAPKDFWFLNNGITIVGTDYTRFSPAGKPSVKVERPQVINGQQTTRVLAEHDCDGASVLVRIMTIEGAGDGEHLEDVVSRVVEATNSQSAVSASDLRSNDPAQIWLERALRKEQWGYIRKKGEESRARHRMLGMKWFVDKEKLAQAVAACELSPATVKGSKEDLFGKYYSSLFASREVFFYLARYALRDEVRSLARGYPDRPHAMHLVLHTAWSKFGGRIQAVDKRRRFVVATRRSSGQARRRLRPLEGGIELLFKAATSFYRSRKNKAADPSTFFKQQSVETRFKEYLAKPGQRKRLRQIERFLAQAATAFDSD